MKKGDFTLPGEAGYEALTMRLAEKWGADVIRDSDGTKLSDDILNSDYGIYSTICLIRSDNEFAKQNMDKLQQNFLMSFPVTSTGDTVEIKLLDRYFTEQFMINENVNPYKYWQVFDRTTGYEVPISNWSYDPDTKSVTIVEADKWHKYTVNFLAIRLWEEISMYNHITNDWGDKEHLMAVDPRYPEVRENILKWLDDWCKSHPSTTVVRFTSMFYNFAWFWGADEKERGLYSDWGSYDFTVSPVALEAFFKENGYKMTSEDFVNGGLYNQTHNAPSDKYRKWMDFTHRFVVEFSKECVDLVHSYGKKAYVFYDDSWIGVEPYSPEFAKIGFDGLIKCVFNGFETRLCGENPYIETKEIRLHPYLFPTGLTGEPTFAPGGNPKLDASRFWVNVRRALLRKPVDRIGLGGYLHLVEPFPDFCDYIEEIADEFRTIKELHGAGKPYTHKGKIGILTSWGSLRSWICSGHLHEHPEIDLTNLLESISGLPFDVTFLSFADISVFGIPEDVKVIINAGNADSAWSGGDVWANPMLVETLTEYIANGGGFIGVNEPTAYNTGDSYFRLSHLLGVDKDTGNRKCIGKYNYDITPAGSADGCISDASVKAATLPKNDGLFVLNKDVKVLKDDNGSVEVALNTFEKGRCVYMSGYRYSLENTALLYELLTYAGRYENPALYRSSNPYTECAYFEESKTLVVINNTESDAQTEVNTANGKLSFDLKPFETVIKKL
ncbi:MAG: 1,3-beta-galactosyl-N-acetylhexosamine phosphorylase [Lachnospiraceae bacterium]|nr:1,3-beta-galactosyl-N-acetylhexosamine phosphorylase [Lachnospiraceae bacterium]